MNRFVATLFAIIAIFNGANAFVSPSSSFGVARASQNEITSLGIFNKKNEDEDLSFIESRDMTREEMLELNAKNEEIMNMELQAMTGFSFVLSLPIFYLCWVAFFSD